MGFDEFMSFALYSQAHGYYSSHVPGTGSDYRTSPALTPWFGRLTCRHLERIWTDLSCPARFAVVEAGGGNGDLAAGVISSAQGPFAGALEWVFVEPMPRIAKLQQTRLAGLNANLQWVGSLEAVSQVTGVVIANEILDNFPVRLIEVAEGGLAEVLVGWGDSELVELRAPVSSLLPPEIETAAGALEVGDRFEVITGLDRWCLDVAGALKQGGLIVIDYGDHEPDIFKLRPTGSLVTYREGRLGLDPFSEVGDEDITAHVNFSELQRAAERAGLSDGESVTQRDWLESAGLSRVVQDLRQAEAIARREERHEDWVALLAERSKVQTIAARGGLGDYLVFTATKGYSHQGL